MFVKLEQTAEETAFVIIAAKQEQQYKNQNQHADSAVITIAAVMTTTRLWLAAAFLRFAAIVMIIAHIKNLP